MSYNQKNRGLPQFSKTPFKFDAPVNENSQNWNVYRLGLSRIRSLAAHSTHWRATCSYPSHGVDFTDYVRGNFKDFNVVDFLGNGECKEVEYVNIRGHRGVHLTAKFWQVENSLSLHIDSSDTRDTRSIRSYGEMDRRFGAKTGGFRERRESYGGRQSFRRSSEFGRTSEVLKRWQ